MLRWFGCLLLVLALAVGAWRLRARSETAWQKVGPGVEMRTLSVNAPGTLGGAVEVVALRTDPSRIRVLQGKARNVSQWRADARSVAVINGGFFDKTGKPLGLRVCDGKKKNSLHEANWGVFYIRKEKAAVMHSRDFRKRFTSLVLIQQAVQCGPRLVVGGKTTDLKPQTARRSGIGVQRDGKVVIAVSSGSLPFDDWAKIWASRDGLNCRDALNLDGGGSTQLSLQTKGQARNIAGAWPVPDVVVIR